jgi:glycosyltransferase involved in cell wall biosynthesis
VVNVFPKTLVLTRSIPPAVTGSAIIMGNLARQFTRDEMLLVGALDPGRPPVTWRSNWPRRVYGMLWSDRWRGERFIRYAQVPLLLIVSLLSLIISRSKAVFVVYPDGYYLLAGYLIARITRKPLYGYFHNTYLENYPNSRLAQWLQPRVFHYALHIFVMSDGMQRLYEHNYPGLRCSPLRHTFNDPLPDGDEPLAALHNPLHLCFAGTLNSSCFEAASRFASMIHEMDGVRLTLLTGTPLPVVERIGFTGPKVTVGTVSRDDLIPRLREADLLLLPHGFTSKFAEEEIKTIFPTKTIEYLISGRPILAHLPADCFLAEFLRSYDCALIVDEPDVEALKRALDRLRQDESLRSKLVCNALRAARQFQAHEVAAQMREIIQTTNGDLPY